MIRGRQTGEAARATRLLRIVAAAGALVAAGTVVAACGHDRTGSAIRAPTSHTTPVSQAAANSPTPAPTGAGRPPALPHGPTGPAHPARPAPPPAAVPVRLLIPAIGVNSGLEPLGLLPDDTLEPPHEWGVAGWYADGIRPGDPGPAVIAGHVDSRNGPAVFFRLRELHAGAITIVRTSDGRALRFVVDSVRQYPKATFPTALVYGPTPLPELRLVTCTGDFDWAARSYLDNLVVSARLA